MKRGSMQCRIPEDMREQLADDPFMRQCFLYGGDPCEGRTEWNHAFTYAGKRINEPWALLPMCHKHHEQQAKWRTSILFMLRQRISQFAAWPDVYEKYPKSTLI